MKIFFLKNIFTKTCHVFQQNYCQRASLWLCSSLNEKNGKISLTITRELKKQSIFISGRHVGEMGLSFLIKVNFAVKTVPNSAKHLSSDTLSSKLNEKMIQLTAIYGINFLSDRETISFLHNHQTWIFQAFRKRLNLERNLLDKKEKRYKNNIKT